MCGIIGYLGPHKATPILLDGLRRLEYRGYDSAGLALVTDSGFHITKAVGHVAELVKVTDPNHIANIGLAHTRWATHGGVTQPNAHPHLSPDQKVILAHNGVIENHQALKSQFEELGHSFASDTDSEVIAHLISQELSNHSTPQAAIQAALAQLHGAYGLVIALADHPDTLFAIRNSSPLVVGVGKNEHVISSDPLALAGHADRVIYLKDHELATITANHLSIEHANLGHITPQTKPLVDQTAVELGNYSTYMLKEIYEQPTSLKAALRGRLDHQNSTARLNGLNLKPEEAAQVHRIILTGCGTSWHAGLVGEHLIESLARIPVEVEYASELRYRNPPIDDQTLIIAISQSGESADTLAAIRELKNQGHRVLSICNVVGSSQARETDGGIYMHAGPEIGVASTKAFTSQLVVLTLLALYLGRLRHLSPEQGQAIINQLENLPDLVQQTLATDSETFKLARKYQTASNMLYLGRQANFPIALEGALKLKEISYLHAEGYPAAEMKHGPLALVDSHTPSLFLVPADDIQDKVLSNMQEIKARQGSVIAITTDDDKRVVGIADDIITVPKTSQLLQPIILTLPLQLFAYHLAQSKGLDVDKPRNLAKSVTVE